MDRRLPPLVARQVHNMLHWVMEDEEQSDDDDEDLEITLLFLLSEHVMARNASYVIRIAGPPIRTPWEVFGPEDFYSYTRFFPSDWDRLCVVPIEDPVITAEGCVCPKKLALYVVLRRWVIPDRWRDIAQHLRNPVSWLKSVYKATVSALIRAYQKVICHIDFLRVCPHLPHWEQCVREEADGLLHDVVCFIDGKPIASCRPSDPADDSDMVRVCEN